MKVYTKGGDEGLTSLYSGERVPKGGLRVECYGTLDELQAFLGQARALCEKDEVRAAVLELERLLVTVMAHVATLSEKGARVTGETVEAMEREIDKFSAALPPFKEFLLPGESRGSAALHVARTVARRAERLLWRLSEEEALDKALLLLVNRLSDFCFVLLQYEDMSGR